MAFNFFKIAKGLSLKGQPSLPTSPVSGDIYYDSTLNKFIGYENSKFQSLVKDQLGINYIKNAIPLLDTAGWAIYANTAQSTPVTGTGGSPNVTLARNTSSPLRSPADFLFTKDAANRQGQGFSYDFSIDSADASKRLSISFDLKVSANYVASDCGIYIYDVTNSTLISPSVVNLPAATSSSTIQIYFNASTSTSYRLIGHIQTVNASAYTLNFVNVVVGPFQVVQTTPQTDEISYSPSIDGCTSVTASYVTYKRIGDMIYVNGYTTLSGSNGSYAAVSLPTGLTIDTTKITNAASTSGNGQIVGSYAVADTINGSGFLVACTVTSTSKVYFAIRWANGTANILTPTTGTIFGNNVSFQFTVPIAQWAGSSVSMASSQVEFAYNTSTATAADDTTSFGYGPGGALIQNITSQLRRRVRFQNPVQSTDTIVVQVKDANNGMWYTVNDFLVNIGPGQNGNICPTKLENTVTYGIGLCGFNGTGNSTDVDVFFGTYSANTAASFGAAGQAWSVAAGSCYWRVVKSANPLSIGQITTPTSMIRLDTGNGYGSTNTKIRRFTNVTESVGSDITYVDSAANGATFTINRSGVYSASWLDEGTGSTSLIGFSKNSSELTSSIANINRANVLIWNETPAAGVWGEVSCTFRANAGDIIRAHSDGNATGTTNNVLLIITQVAI
jgi:hypothetical protein